MKSIVVSVLMCLAMSLGIQAKAAAGQIDQAIDQKVTQVVKDKVWKLKADMVFLSGGKTEALPSDSCFMEVNGAEAAVCLPYLSGEQDGERVNLQGKVTAYSFRDKGDHFTVNLRMEADQKNYSFTIHVYKEDGLGSILLNSTQLSYSAELVR